MPKNDYRTLPKIRDSLSHLYLEYGRVEQTKNGVEFVNKQGAVQIPAAGLSALMLGPGTSITHRAVQNLVGSGCLLIWNGQQGVRYYAHSTGETHKAYKIQKQAELASIPETRKKVALRMFKYRFKQQLGENLPYGRIQGIEGKRVQKEYEQIAKKYKIEWKGRNYDRYNWGEGDEPNRALSTASSCLNGICHSAIVAAGYSPALGFIHQGRQLSFVYDIADLYKTKIAVPIAFATVADGAPKLETEVRKRCRQAFKNFRLLDRIIPDIDAILSIEEELPEGFDPDDDPAMPAKWWLPPEECEEAEQ